MVAKKNPFASTKKKTIKRDANEVYPQRGLNKLSTSPTTPIDILFSNLEKKLEGSIDTFTIESLYTKFAPDDEDEDVSSVDLSQFKDCDFLVEFQHHYLLVDQLLKILLQIQLLSQQQQFHDKALIKISLHDIKTFSKLVNVIIIFGVYPALANFQIGIPFAKRNLKSFQSSKIAIKPLAHSQDYKYNHMVLVLLYDRLFEILSMDSDVRDLLTKGTGFSDFLTISIALQTIPWFSSSRLRYTEDFAKIVLIPDTYELFQTYSLLMATPSPGYFKQFVIDHLQRLHYDAPKNDGLLTLIEFVLGLRENDDIDVAKFEQVTSVVLAKPKAIPTVEYFTKIGDQCYQLLININRPVVASCVGFILETLWYKNSRIVEDFVLKKIWNTLNPPSNKIGEADLNNVINVLISLTKKVTSTEFMLAIIKPILLPLWGYYTFLKSREKPTEIITNILISYFVVISNSKSEELDVYGLDTISRNLLFDGGNWTFQFGPNGLTQISEKIETLSTSDPNSVQKFVDDLDHNCKYFVLLLENLDEDLISKLFVMILKRWLNNEQKNQILVDNPFFTLIDLRLLESIGDKFKESLAKTPKDMLELVDSVLLMKLSPEETNTGEEVDSDDEDEEDDENSETKTISVVLELLSAILTEIVDLNEDSRKLLVNIQSSLNKYGLSSDGTSASAKSLSDRIAAILNGENQPTTEHEAQKQILTRAITSLNDPLVPIRAHGLYLLRQLMEAKSEVVNLSFVINLHLVQLKDPEPFIYLNVIKGLESLIELDENEVLVDLCKIYTNKDVDLDEQLRVGEVLLRYVQRADGTFVGNIAQLIVGTMLQVIDTPVNSASIIDDRLRMSAMSILGMCCNTNPIGMYDRLTDALDCAIGILQLETQKDKAIMRNSAIVLIHDLILGSSKSEAVPFPKEYQQKVYNVLRYIADTDNDLLVREQAQIVLNTIEEISQQAFELLQEKQSEGMLNLNLNN
jgi:hypothetical protein